MLVSTTKVMKISEREWNTFKKVYSNESYETEKLEMIWLLTALQFQTA